MVKLVHQHVGTSPIDAFMHVNARARIHTHTHTHTHECIHTQH